MSGHRALKPSRPESKDQRVIRVGVFVEHARDGRWLSAAFAGTSRFRLAEVTQRGAGSLPGASLAADVVLIHHRPPSATAVKWVRQITDCRPAVPVVVVAAKCEARAIVEAVRAGAMGYLIRPLSSQEVRQAVSLAAQGGAPLCSTAARRLVEHLHNGTPSALIHRFNLTPRDLDVLVLLNRGCSNKEIAGQLDLSLHTIREYMRRLYGKMQVHSRAQAVRKLHEL